MAEPDFNKMVDELFSLQTVTTRKRTPTNTGALTVLAEHPRTALTSAAGLYALNRGANAWQGMYRDIGKTMKASGIAEAEAVKELKAMGYQAKGTMPKVGSKEFIALARQASLDAKLGWIPYFGQKYTNASATAQLPKVQLTGSLPVLAKQPYAKGGGLGVLKPAQVTPPLSAKVVLELAKEGRIHPQGALSTAKNFPLREAIPPQGVSNWVKAGRAYKDMMGGDVKINSLKNARGFYKGARLGVLSSALELGGGVYDVLGEDGVFNREYMKQVGQNKDPLVKAVGVGAGVLKSGMRMGSASANAITWGGWQASGAPDYEERGTARERATALYMKGNKEAGDRGNELYPLSRGRKTMSKDSAQMAPNEQSLRWQQIYSDELSKEGVPESIHTPDMYKGPNYEYVFGQEPRLLSNGPTQDEIEEHYAKMAYIDEQNANITPSMRVNDFMTGLWR